jgi:epoxyqueuosine reductase
MKPQITQGKYQLISTLLLDDVNKELAELETNCKLNSFQKWIIHDLYDFNLPTSDFTIKSLLLIAIPHPIYADIRFMYESKEYKCVSLVSPDFDSVGKLLDQESRTNGFRSIEARNLPLKRIAVQSGLAEYGRNNITYIKGMGSCFSYTAFFTNLEPDINTLKPVALAHECRHCTICQEKCPTQAIKADSFIIDNERCLSYLNETGEPFPAWVPISVHHSLYDCIICQLHCPMNRAFRDKKGEEIFFSAIEIQLLLDQTDQAFFPEDLKRKVKYLGLDQWPDGVSKNIKAIIQKAES